MSTEPVVTISEPIESDQDDEEIDLDGDDLFGIDLEDEELEPEPEPEPQPKAQPQPKPKPKPEPKPKLKVQFQEEIEEMAEPKPKSQSKVTKPSSSPKDWAEFQEFVSKKHGKLNSEQSQRLTNYIQTKHPKALEALDQNLELIRRLGNFKYKNVRDLTMDDYLAWFAVETGKVKLPPGSDVLLGLKEFQEKADTIKVKVEPGTVQTQNSRKIIPGILSPGQLFEGVRVVFSYLGACRPIERAFLVTLFWGSLMFLFQPDRLFSPSGSLRSWSFLSDDKDATLLPWWLELVVVCLASCLVI